MKNEENNGTDDIGPVILLNEMSWLVDDINSLLPGRYIVTILKEYLLTHFTK